MNQLLSAGLLGAGLFLAGCETTVVTPNENHGHHGYYNGNSYDDGNAYDDGYNGHHRTNSQTNVTNVNETNVTRVNRTNVTNNSTSNHVTPTKVRTAPTHVQTTTSAHTKPQHPTSAQVKVQSNKPKKNHSNNGNGNGDN